MEPSLCQQLQTLNPGCCHDGEAVYVDSAVTPSTSCVCRILAPRALKTYPCVTHKVSRQRAGCCKQQHADQQGPQGVAGIHMQCLGHVGGSPGGHSRQDMVHKRHTLGSLLASTVQQPSPEWLHNDHHSAGADAQTPAAPACSTKTGAQPQNYRKAVQSASEVVQSQGRVRHGPYQVKKV